MLIQRIPGVFNYCDRWCERCRFQQSCDVYHDLRCHEAGIPVEHEAPERDWDDALEIPPMTPEDMAQCIADLERRDQLTDQHPIASVGQSRGLRPSDSTSGPPEGIEL